MTRKKILVVDDDAEIRATVTLVLGARFDVVQASNGAEALELAERESFPLALVDFEMPGMSGVELAASLKRLLPSTIVVMLTGSREIEVARQALDRGAAEFITKPFDPPALRKEISRLLGAPSLDEEDEAYRPWRLE
jgi:CheY-like chemotaxis protein